MIVWIKKKNCWKASNKVFNAYLYKDKYENWLLDCHAIGLNQVYIGKPDLSDVTACQVAREMIVEIITELYEEIKDYIL